MPRSRLWNEAGSASLEFITAGMILLVPVVYLILAMSSIQSAALGVEGAARQAARVFVQADDPASAARSAERAIRFALADYGLDADAARISIRCEPDPRDCLARHAYVTVTVSASVPLPLAPTAISVDRPLSITLESTATQQVSRFRITP